jgi:hypothetical protein
VLPYDVLQQLARDRCQQREAEAHAERLELLAPTPKPWHSPRLAVVTTLALLARARRQTARA